jgi:hypothetical protein
MLLVVVVLWPIAPAQQAFEFEFLEKVRFKDVLFSYDSSHCHMFVIDSLLNTAGAKPATPAATPTGEAEWKTKLRKKDERKPSAARYLFFDLQLSFIRLIWC